MEYKLSKKYEDQRFMDMIMGPNPVKLCEELEKQGRAVLVRPETPLKSLEKDVKVLRQSWQAGYDQATKHMDEIKALFH